MRHPAQVFMKRRAESIKRALAILLALAPLTLAGEQIAPTAETAWLHTNHAGSTSRSVHSDTESRCHGCREVSRLVTSAGKREWRAKTNSRRTWTSIVSSFFASLAETQLAATVSSKPDYITRLAEQIEPGRVGTAERLPVYIRHFQREVIGDTRLFAFHVEARMTDEGAVSLTGHVEFDEQREALETFLNHLGFDRMDNRVEVLPAKELGRLRYGLVKASHSLCHGRPTRDAEVVTDSLLGDPVFLLKQVENDFFLCHTAEGYVGYIEGKDIRRVESDSFVKYRSGSLVHVQKDCSAETGRWIPEGARLKWSRSEKDRVVVLLPSKEEASIPAACCEIRDGATDRRAERAIENARRLLGTPYLWGGKTSSGIDCSGLVQIAFAAEGINLPRDSSQQVYLGRLTATRWHRDGMRRGDTLYFLGRSGKITHTAIYLGDQRYLESAGRGVRVSSFRPEAPNYHAMQSKRLAFAKRLLD